MNILIAAVGGQGALLAARIIGNYALLQSQQVKVSEIRGMSQRGGSVVTHVRFAPEVHSPVIEMGQADILLGLEMLEAARAIAHLRPGGRLIVAKQQILPLPVLTGAAEYPPALLESFAILPITTHVVERVGCGTPSRQRQGHQHGAYRCAGSPPIRRPNGVASGGRRDCARKAPRLESKSVRYGLELGPFE